jgi:hypothetical protein
MDNIKLYKSLEREIAHTDEVDQILRKQARVLQSAAQARLARHRRTGEHHITVNKGSVDHFVNLEGPAAMSLEEGHFVANGSNTDEIIHVGGLHILRGLL